MSSVQIPPELLTDLQDAFSFYDKDDTGYISFAHFRNILQNFGFHKMSKKEIDDELKRGSQIDPIKTTQLDFNQVKSAITYRYTKGGSTDEAKECFKIFDKRERGQLTINDLRSVLPHYLSFPLGEQEL